MPTSSPITPPTIRPGQFSSPPTHPCARPPPSADIHFVTTSSSVFGRFNPFLPRLQPLEVPAFGELVFPPQRKPPPSCNQAGFLSPGAPKPANERLWKRCGGLRIVSVSLRVCCEIHAPILTEIHLRCLLGFLFQIHQVNRAWWVSVLLSLFHKQRRISHRGIRPFHYPISRHSKPGMEPIFVARRSRLDHYFRLPPCCHIQVV